MHPRIRAERRAIAQQRIESAVSLLAEQQPELVAFADRLRATNKDPELEALFRLEAIADFLSQLTGPEQEPPSELAALDGLGPELVQALADKGIVTLVDLTAASDEDLLAVSGIGKGLLKKLRSQIIA